MRKRVFTYLVLSVLMGAFLGGGCGVYRKYAANKAIEAVNKSIDEAREKEVDKYVSDVFNQAQTLINEASENVTGGNYEEATSKTQQANDKIEQAVGQLARKKKIIQGKQTDLNQLEKDAVETLDKADQSPSRDEALEEIAEAKGKLETLQADIRKLKNKKPQFADDYDNMLTQANQVLQEVQRAYNITLADEANLLNSEILRNLNTLRELAFDVYTADRAMNIEDQFKRFLEEIDAESYAQAIAVGKVLEATMVEHIPVARFARAEQSTAQAEERLADAATMGAVEDAAGQMKAGQEALAEAREYMASGEYDQAFSSARLSLQSAELALEDVKALIESDIDRIRELIDEADDAGAQDFDPTNLAQSRTNLAQAFNFLSEAQYADARKAQRMADDAASKALMAAQKGQASEMLEVVNDIVAEARREGAAKYVSDSLLAAQGRLSRAQAIFNEGDYTAVLDVAAEAEALAEKMHDDLRAYNEQQISKAEAQLAASEVAKAEAYAPEMLENAIRALADSKLKKSSEAFRQSIELADKSIMEGKKAEEKTYKLRTEETLESSATERQLALDSGAREHSSAVFLASIEQRETSQRQYDTGNYMVALGHAQKADSGFRSARMSKITKAAAMTASANGALAPQYAAELIGQAESRLAASILDMDAKRYEESNGKADEATQLATQAEYVTWNKRSDDIIEEWEGAYAKAIEDFAKEKAPAALAESHTFGVDAKAESVVKNYYPSYEYGVKAMEAIGKTNDVLSVQATKTLEYIKARTSEIGRLTIDEQGRKMLGQLIEMSASIEGAKEASDYKAIFAFEKEFIAASANVEKEIELHNLTSSKQVVSGKLNEANALGIAKFVQQDADAVKAVLSGIIPQERLGDYAEAMKELADLEGRIDQYTYEADAELQSMIAEMRRQLNEARHAGALNVIADQYNEALASYRAVQMYPRSDTTDYNELFALADDARTKCANTFAHTNLAVEIDEYQTNLMHYMKEMKILMDGFSTVTDYDERFHKTASSSSQVDVYREMQHDTTAVAQRMRAGLLLEKVKGTAVPETQEAVQSLAITTFEEFLNMAILFEKFGQYEEGERELRNQYIDRAFRSLDKLMAHNAQLQGMLSKEATEESKKKLGWKFWESF